MGVDRVDYLRLNSLRTFVIDSTHSIWTVYSTKREGERERKNREREGEIATELKCEIQGDKSIQRVMQTQGDRVRNTEEDK